MFARADDAAGQGSLPAGSRVILSDLSVRVRANAGDLLPVDGPLAFVSNHIACLRRGVTNKRRLAEFAQMIYHLVRPRSLLIHVNLSFSPSIRLADLQPVLEGRRLMPAILARAQHLLKEHQQYCCIL